MTFTFDRTARWVCIDLVIFTKTTAVIPTDTIIALATPPGIGAIAVIRLSGPKAIAMASKHFRPIRDKALNTQHSHTVHLGYIIDNKRVIDKVLITLFKNPNSYTGEDVIEISCHGSRYIQQEILQLFIRAGCRMADPGEFTLRAFLNGKMDLSQAEAVADLIASENEASHTLAIQQMRGGIRDEISALRAELLDFASLIELELDFAGEDVEFADKEKFQGLLERIRILLKNLLDSFQLGNAIKQGIPVAIIGEPNVGKSTLLNALLNEEKAIVSDIPGTTRDAIEDEIHVHGVGFRFIDTAGLRETEDVIEGIGIQRTHEKIADARVILHLSEAGTQNATKAAQQDFEAIKAQYPDKTIIRIFTKTDVRADEYPQAELDNGQVLYISAKTGQGIQELKSMLYDMVLGGEITSDRTMLTNSRHYEALQNALEAILDVERGMEEDRSGDLLAIDIRQALDHLGEVTGEITTEELLGNIFSNFCIGK